LNVSGLPIYVINLQQRQDRREQATRQLQDTGARFSFFSAINRDAGRQYFSGVNRALCFMSLGRQLSEAEIGCFASHRELWKHCRDSSEAIIIMEDDFQLQENFAAALRLLPSHIENCGVIRLDNLRRGRFREGDTHELARDTGFSFEYLLRIPLNATAYALSPSAARQLLMHCDRVPTALDNYLQLSSVHKQSIVALRPEPVDLNELAADSSIVESDRDRKSAGHRLARLLRIPFRIWNRHARNRVNRNNLARLSRAYQTATLTKGS